MSKLALLRKKGQTLESSAMVVHFKSVKIDVLHVQKRKEPNIIASEGQNFDLIYNSSNSEIFVCPHGSSLWYVDSNVF